MIKRLYKVWNKTKSYYPSNIVRSNAWCGNKDHATTRMEKHQATFTSEEFELHEYAVIPLDMFTALNIDDINELQYVAENNPNFEYSEVVLKFIDIYRKVLDTAN